MIPRSAYMRCNKFSPAEFMKRALPSTFILVIGLSTACTPIPPKTNVGPPSLERPPTSLLTTDMLNRSSGSVYVERIDSTYVKRVHTIFDIGDTALKTGVIVIDASEEDGGAIRRLLMAGGSYIGQEHP